MLQWMDEEGLSQEDLDSMDNVNLEFSAWLMKREWNNNPIIK